MDRSTRATRGMMLLLGLVTAAALAACGGGAASPPAGGATSGPVAGTDAPGATAPAAGVTAVRIAGFAFDPAAVTVTAGSTVTWTSDDEATHTVAWEDGTAASGSITKGGAPYTRTFDTPGTFAYACGIHPAMKGSVTVEP